MLCRSRSRHHWRRGCNGYRWTISRTHGTLGIGVRNSHAEWTRTVGSGATWTGGFPGPDPVGVGESEGLSLCSGYEGGSHSGCPVDSDTSFRRQSRCADCGEQDCDQGKSYGCRVRWIAMSMKRRLPWTSMLQKRRGPVDGYSFSMLRSRFIRRDCMLSLL